MSGNEYENLLLDDFDEIDFEQIDADRLLAAFDIDCQEQEAPYDLN